MGPDQLAELLRWTALYVDGASGETIEDPQVLVEARHLARLIEMRLDETCRAPASRPL